MEMWWRATGGPLPSCAPNVPQAHLRLSPIGSILHDFIRGYISNSFIESNGVSVMRSVS